MIVRLTCPACSGPVYAPHDSDRDLVTCSSPACGVALVTRRSCAGIEVPRLVQLDTELDEAVIVDPATMAPAALAAFGTAARLADGPFLAGCDADPPTQHGSGIAARLPAR